MKEIKMGLLSNLNLLIEEWEEKVQLWCEENTTTEEVEQQGFYYSYPNIAPGRSWFSPRDAAIYVKEVDTLPQKTTLSDGMLLERATRTVTIENCPPHPYGDRPTSKSTRPYKGTVGDRLRVAAELSEELHFTGNYGDYLTQVEGEPEEGLMSYQILKEEVTEEQLTPRSKKRVTSRNLLILGIFNTYWKLFEDEVVYEEVIHDDPGYHGSISTSMDVDGFWNK